MAEYSHELIKDMTDAEYIFCEEYLSSLSVGLAASAADIAHRQPVLVELMNRPIVIEYLTLRKQEIQKTFITRDDIILGIMNTIEMSKEPQPVLSRSGMATSEMKADLKSAMKGYELLSKIMGLEAKDAIVIPESTQQVNLVIKEGDIEKFKESFNADY